MSETTAAYFLDNYGRCRYRPDGLGCMCLIKMHRGEQSWLGRGCQYWEPLGATSHGALFERPTPNQGQGRMDEQWVSSRK